MLKETPLIILLEQMDKFLKTISPLKIQVRKKDVEKFYEITKNTSSNLEDPSISPEYLMTLLAPLATKIIVNLMGGIPNLPQIRGVIHTESEVNYLKPLEFGSYDIGSNVESLQKKEGKSGNYLSFKFRMSLFNQANEEVANDIHHFFLRVGEDVL